MIVNMQCESTSLLLDDQYETDSYAYIKNCIHEGAREASEQTENNQEEI